MDRGFECTWSHICNFSRLLYFGFIHSQFFRKRITPQKSFTRMLKMALHVVASKGVKKNDVLFSGFFYLHRILSAPSTTCISLWHARPSLHIHEKLRKDFYWLASIPYHAIMLEMYAVSLHLWWVNDGSVEVADTDVVAEARERLNSKKKEARERLPKQQREGNL